MTEPGRWRISVTAPDWGQDHLTPDVVVAFVDDELAHRPYVRATQHLAQCPECSAQVAAQSQARSVLRTAEAPSLPTSLLSSLRSIPQDTEIPDAEIHIVPAGLAVTADGRFVTVQRAAASSGTRRVRFGTGVAVTGLALGALAFGAPSASSSTTPAPTAADRGVLGGPVLGGVPGVVDARLRIVATPTGRAPRLDGPGGER